MEQTISNGLPRETVEAIMMLYKNTKVKIRSPDGDRDFFDFVAGGLLEDTLAAYQFIMCLDYVLGRSLDLIKEKGFTLAKARSRRYPAQTIMDYAGDRTLLADTITQAESLLHSLERAAGGMGLHVNADKTDFTCFNQRCDISLLNSKSLKLVDEYTYLRGSILSTKNYIIL